MSDKAYQPEIIEPRWYQSWESAGYFRADVESGVQRESFCVMLPPPNVTGTLHMGHAFQSTLVDLIIRYQRMRGANTLWQPGMDHAGIATQMVVERQLIRQGLDRMSLGREAFERRVWEWKEQSGGGITRQLRRLGASLDWSRERFTMDPAMSRAVHTVFIRLYREGLIYRGKRLVNWDPVLRTAISDLEVNNIEEQGHLWYIRYPVVSESTAVTVATTRPETLFGDVAVAVHPDDVRWGRLIGKNVHLPLTGRTIPIIGDASVNLEFGTGCVKITPAHDFNDYAIGKRHQLPMRNIMTDDGRLNEEVPEDYRGKTMLEAREQVVVALREQDLLERIETHTHKVPKGDRSGVIIEPYLTDQWFVKVQPLAQPAIEAVEQGRIRFTPEHWSKTFFEWMRNIEDWCISRQIWWGHRIPAWYDEQGRIYVGEDEDDIRRHYHLSPELVLRQDDDVLDTWFSSALWPFSTLGWPDPTPGLRIFYPTNVMVTGFDIIFFWVARMIMMGLHFTGEAPFREVYIHGLVRDAEGHKMSKSKGNVLDPMDVIDGITIEQLLEKRTQGLMQPEMAQRIVRLTKREFPEGIPAYGADALRMTFASLASGGRDVRFDLQRVGGYRNFCNKLWNAGRYIMGQVGDAPRPPKSEADVSLPERWIISRFGQVVVQSRQAVTDYRFDWFVQSAHEFTWHIFCDWYLEMSKTSLLLTQDDSDAGHRIRWVLVDIFESLLRLLHPMIPFISEEIWQRIAPLAGVKAESIMLQSYPESSRFPLDEEADAAVGWLISVVGAIRQIRSQNKIAPRKKIKVVLQGLTPVQTGHIRDMLPWLMDLAGLDQLDLPDQPVQIKGAAVVSLGRATVAMPLAGLIDPDAEQERISKQLEKLRAAIQQGEKKLSNEHFLARAPENVVDELRQRVKEQGMSLMELEAQWNILAGMRGSGENIHDP